MAIPVQRSWKLFIADLKTVSLTHETLKEYARAARFPVDVILGATQQELNAELLKFAEANAPMNLDLPVTFPHTHLGHKHFYTLGAVFIAFAFALIAVVISVRAENLAMSIDATPTEATVPGPATTTTVAPTTTIAPTTSSTRAPTTTSTVAGNVTCTPFNTDTGERQELRNNVCFNVATGQPVPTSTSTTRRP